VFCPRPPPHGSAPPGDTCCIARRGSAELRRLDLQHRVRARPHGARL